MKKLMLIVAMTILFPFVGWAQYAGHTFRFSANYSCAFHPLDSILIENLTKGGSMTLYYPDTVASFVFTGIGAIDPGKRELQVSQNYPNPFSGETSIDVYLPEPDQLHMYVHDLAGRKVTEYVSFMDQGSHQFTFYACDQQAYLLTVISKKHERKQVMIQVGKGNRSVARIVHTQMTSRPLTTMEVQEMPYNTGDELRFTGFVTDGDGHAVSVKIEETPDTSKDYLFDIANEAPEVPTEITGEDWVHGMATGLIYEVANQEGIEYHWDVPEKWSVVAGQGTHNITVNAGGQSGDITVRAENACGISPTALLPVKAYFIITIDTDSPLGGTATPEYAEIEAGETINVHAQPNDGWVFQRWSGDLESDQNPTQITMDGDKDLLAEFTALKIISVSVENPIDTLVISHQHTFRVVGEFSDGSTADLSQQVVATSHQNNVTILEDRTIVGARSGLVEVELKLEDFVLSEEFYVYEVEFVDIDPRFISYDNCQLRVPIVIINYFPTKDGINHDQSVGPTGFWHAPDVTVENVKIKVMEDFIVAKKLIEYGTRFRDFGSKTVDPYICMDVVSYINVFEMDLVPYINDVKTIDYYTLFEKLGIETMVNEMGVKEIWLSIFPKYGFPSVVGTEYEDPDTYYDHPESNMSSPTTGDISNSPRIQDDLPIYNSTYVVYGQNNHRGADTFIHNRGHQIEAQMHYIEKDKVDGQLLFWNHFVGRVDGVYTGRCGNTHWPPNAVHDYDYGNKTLVASDIKEWIPEGGKTSLVNVDTWTNTIYDFDMTVNRWGLSTDDFQTDPHSKWLTFWFQSIPGYNNGIPYQRNGKTYVLNNWWDIFYNWDDAVKNGTTLWRQTEIINSVTDIDDNEYAVVIIGSQMWMSENLRTTRYRNGEQIDYVGTNNVAWQTNSQGAMSWFDDNPIHKEQLGGFYNWNAVNNENGLCPEGWHIPSDEDWKYLEGMVDDQHKLGDPIWDNENTWRGVNVGFKLKTEDGWVHDGSGNNASGFSAHPGGQRTSEGDFEGYGAEGHWWTSNSGTSEMAWSRSLSGPSNGVMRKADHRSVGNNVRCMRWIDSSAIPPEIRTTEISQISTGSAMSGGNIVDEGGSEVISRGLVWGTSPHPTVSNNEDMTTQGSGTGGFTTELTGLMPNTVYYLRAYAVNKSGTSYGNQLSLVTLSLDGSFACGEDIYMNYRSNVHVFKTIERHGLCWLDRNLGAARVPLTKEDPEGFGDLFQWGRLNDGHQEKTSGVTSQISSTDVPGHDKFITSSIGSMDWREPRNDNLWQGTDGINNPCPPDWRLPTENELNAERMSWTINGSDGAFDSPLKWAEGGSRMTGGGLLPGHFGVIWSSTVSGSESKYLYYYSGNTHMFTNIRAAGQRVRCVKDIE